MQKKPNVKRIKTRPILEPSSQSPSLSSGEEFATLKQRWLAGRSEESEISLDSRKTSQPESMESFVMSTHYSDEGSRSKLSFRREEFRPSIRRSPLQTKSASPRRRKMLLPGEYEIGSDVHSSAGSTLSNRSISSSMRSDRKTKSIDSMERSCDNVLKKTEELISFGSRVGEEIKTMTVGSLPSISEKIFTAELQKQSKKLKQMEAELEIENFELADSPRLSEELKLSLVNEKDGLDLKEELKKTEIKSPMKNFEKTVILKKYNKAAGDTLEKFRAKKNLKEVQQEPNILSKDLKENEKEKEEEKSPASTFLKKDRIIRFIYQTYENFLKEAKLNMADTKKEKKEEEEKVQEDSTVPGDTEGTTVKEDLEIKTNLREFFFYLIFLVLLTTVGLGMVSSDMFHFSDTTAKFFMNTPTFERCNASGPVETNFQYVLRRSLRDSMSFADFWAFAESVLLDLLYSNFYMSNQDPRAHTSDSDRIMFYSNQIVGVPRMRQVRVKSDSCQIHPNVQRFFSGCYYYYSVFSADTKPIRTDMSNALTSTAWVYTESSFLQSLFYWGDISFYGGGGYYIDFSTHKETMLSIIHELKLKNWIGQATRAVFIDFTLYNANINLFCVCKLVFEFPPVGGMIPRADFTSLKLYRYISMGDFFILGCELTICLIGAYYSFDTFRNLRKYRMAYLFSIWNICDLWILLFLHLYFVFNITLYVYISIFQKALEKRDDVHTDFEVLKSFQVMFNNIIAILLFSAWVKLFKYLNFNIIMKEFRVTVVRSFKEIAGFIPMFLTMLSAFALLGYLLFGNQVKEFSSLGTSFLSLLHAFLGNFEYAKIQESDRILGPLYYISFIFFIIFVLLNVFIAIINDAYATVKTEVMTDVPKTGTYLKRGFLNFCKSYCCGLDKVLDRKKHYMKRQAFEELKQSLKSAGFTDIEIKIFFSKYKIDMYNALNHKTRRKLIEDLELKRVDFSETAEQFQINMLKRRMDELKEKMDEVETNLQPVLDKVDILIKRH